MPTLTLKMEMDNAAFAECNGCEAARILRGVADAIDGLHFDRDTDPYDRIIILRDANGNTVGEAKVTR